MNTVERNRDRTGFGDLTKLADKQRTGAPEVASPDSSGFVDLALFSAEDPDWVERALAHAQSTPPVVITEAIVAPERNAAIVSNGKRVGVAAAAGVFTCAAATLAIFGAVHLVRSARPARVDKNTASSIPVTTMTAPVATAIASARAQAVDPVPVPIAAVAAVDPPADPKPAPASPARASANKAAPRHRTPPSATPVAGNTAPALPTASPPAAGSLDSSISSAIATSDAARPERPAPGNVTGALQGVLPAARACLKAGDAPERATVVFGSSGATTRVDVDGDRATCVQSALSRARVPAFNAATYSAVVNVRPQ